MFAKKFNNFCRRNYIITEHAKKRMRKRGIKVNNVRNVLRFGRVLPAREAEIFVFEGINVVRSYDGYILTVYENRNLSSLKYRSRIPDKSIA
ncbi:MAG: DUF4258 domain-containing protein [bacterium]